MSLLNISIAPTRALIGVDTCGQMLNGQLVHTSKMIPLVHAGVVFAGRGELKFLNFVYHLCHTPCWFDGIAHDMEVVLAMAYREMLAATAAAGLDAAITEAPNQIAVVGWSRERNCMAGFNYMQVDREHFAREEIKGGLLSPGDIPVEHHEHVNSEAAMLRVARAQVAFCHRRYPGKPIGGRLLVATVEPGRLAINDAGSLEINL